MLCSQNAYCGTSSTSKKTDQNNMWMVTKIVDSTKRMFEWWLQTKKYGKNINNIWLDTINIFYIFLRLVHSSHFQEESRLRSWVYSFERCVSTSRLTQYISLFFRVLRTLFWGMSSPSMFEFKNDTNIINILKI